MSRLSIYNVWKLLCCFQNVPFLSLNFFYRICTCPSKRAESLAVARLLNENIVGLTLIAPLRPDWLCGASWQGLLGISNQACKSWPLSSYKIKITEEKSSKMRREGQGKATAAPRKLGTGIGVRQFPHITWFLTTAQISFIALNIKEQLHQFGTKPAWIVHVTTVQLTRSDTYQRRWALPAIRIGLSYVDMQQTRTIHSKPYSVHNCYGYPELAKTLFWVLSPLDFFPFLIYVFARGFFFISLLPWLAFLFPRCAKTMDMMKVTETVMLWSMA